MMYASKIDIKREPQEIDFCKNINVSNGLLTLKLLSKHIKEGEKFCIFDVDDGHFSTKTMLTVYCKRMETQKEVKKRIKQQEAYMEGYYKHHEKYSKKKQSKTI